jgi:hypothetical protein
MSRGSLSYPPTCKGCTRDCFNSAVIEVISDEMREVVEAGEPELSHKLPPQAGRAPR